MRVIDGEEKNPEYPVRMLKNPKAEISEESADAMQDSIRAFTKGRDATGEAFTALYLRYRTPLIGFVRTKFPALRFDEVEDIVQETFLLAVQHAADFRGEARFDVWLCSIARHQSLNRFRGKASGQVNLAAESKYLLQGNESTGEDNAIRDETVAQVREAMHALPKLWEAVVLDVEIDGKKYDECAEHLHIPIGTVRSMLHRAKAHMKERLASLVPQAS